MHFGFVVVRISAVFHRKEVDCKYREGNMYVRTYLIICKGCHDAIFLYGKNVDTPYLVSVVPSEHIKSVHEYYCACVWIILLLLTSVFQRLNEAIMEKEVVWENPKNVFTARSSFPAAVLPLFSFNIHPSYYARREASQVLLPSCITGIRYRYPVRQSSLVSFISLSSQFLSWETVPLFCFPYHLLGWDTL